MGQGGPAGHPRAGEMILEFFPFSSPSLPQKPRSTVADPEAPLLLGQVDCLLQGLQFDRFLGTRFSKPP